MEDYLTHVLHIYLLSGVTPSLATCFTQVALIAFQGIDFCFSL